MLIPWAFNPKYYLVWKNKFIFSLFSIQKCELFSALLKKEFHGRKWKKLETKSLSETQRY
jgi:hypothetical protein